MIDRSTDEQCKHEWGVIRRSSRSGCGSQSKRHQMESRSELSHPSKRPAPDRSGWKNIEGVRQSTRLHGLLGAAWLKHVFGSFSDRTVACSKDGSLPEIQKATDHK